MRKHEDVLLNSATGLPISGGTVTVRVANASPGTGALASIYSDNGITLIGGSVVTTSAVGRFNFYAPDGRYDLTFAGTGFSSYIVSDVEIADTQSVPTYRADEEVGADAGAKIAAAASRAPSTGAIVDARGFEGAQVIGSTLTISKNGIKLLLGGATFAVSSGVQIVWSGNDGEIEGLGDLSLIDAKAETSTTVSVSVSGSRVKLHHFKVQGSRAGGGGSGNAVSIQFSSAATTGHVHDVTVTKSGSHGVMAISRSDFHAYNNVITDVGGSGIWTEGDRDGEWIEGNRVDLAAQTVNTQAGGIHIKAGASRHVTDIHVLRNRVTNTGSTGIVCNPTSFRAQNVEISGNTIDTTGTRSAAAGIAGEGLVFTGDQGRINDNRINKSYVMGILPWGSVADTVMIGNIISNSSQVGVGSSAAIECTPTTDDTSGDGIIKRLIIANTVAYDDQGTHTQNRPARMTKGTGGTYSSNNIISNITSFGNVSAGIDFGTDADKWNSYGHQIVGSLGTFPVGNNVVMSTANNATLGIKTLSESITLSTGGLTTDSAANLLPANSIILGVTARITTTITTTTDWKLGDATQAARFTAANATLASGTTTVGMNHHDPTVATANLGPVQVAAAKLRITCTGANPGAGVIRVTVNYLDFVAPTS